MSTGVKTRLEAGNADVVEKESERAGAIRESAET